MNFLDRYILGKHSNEWLKSFYKEKFEIYKNLSASQRDIIEASRDTASLLRENLIYTKRELFPENFRELGIIEELENDCVKGIEECSSALCVMTNKQEENEKNKTDEMQAHVLEEVLNWVEETLNARGIKIHLENDEPAFQAV